jgi:hypothetical protein
MTLLLLLRNSEYVGQPAAPSGLTATAVSSSQIDLAWVDNAEDVAGVNEVQTITFDATPEAGTFTLTYDEETTDAIAYDADAAAIVAALEATSAFEVGDVAVQAIDGGFSITYQGGLAAMSLPEITANSSLKQAADTIDITVTQNGIADVASTPSISTTTSAVEGVSEVQTITFAGTPDSGSWTINGETVANGASATASDVEAAIEAAGLPCSVSGSFGGGFAVTFDSQAPVAALTVVTSSLLDAGSSSIGNTVTETTAGVTPVSQVDTITFDATPVAGSMTINGFTCNWNENAGPLDPDTNAVPTVSGAVTSATTPASGTITITWSDTDSHTPVSVATDTLLSVVGRPHIFTIELSDAPTEGNWNIGANGYWGGSDLGYNASSGDIEVSLQDVPNSYQCSVTGSNPWTVTSDANVADPVITGREAASQLRKAVGITIDTDTEGSPEKWEDTGSEVHRSTDGISYSLLVDLGANMESWPDETCSPSTLYYYRVRSYNDGGYSNWSNVDSDTTESAPSSGARGRRFTLLTPRNRRGFL